MIIKKVKLKNIRSYISEEINLDKGITLLSGDIGSGKSTILLAIDFALFGLRKGYLSGSALLRNGQQNGSVELCFEIDNKEITIKRNLKRSSDSITQDYGSLKLSDEKEYSAIELKQFILALLNYPKEYLTKSKYFIYNYTIYTPQEEMKQILLGDKEYRLDAIRKIFGIDKYKRVAENSKILTDFIKFEKKEFSIIIEDFHKKQEEKEEKEKQIIEKNKLSKELANKLEIIQNKIALLDNESSKVENSIKELHNLKKEIELKELEINLKSRETRKNKEEIALLEAEISKLDKETKIDLVFNKEEKIELEEYMKKTQDKLEKLKSQENKLSAKKSLSLEILKSIENLKQCPTCKQEVSLEYKNKIFAKENENIGIIDKELNLIKEEIKILNKDISAYRENLDNLIKKENILEIMKIKKENIQQKSSKFEEIKTHVLAQDVEIEKLNTAVKELKLKLSDFSDIDKKYDAVKKELNLFQKEHKEIEVKKGINESEISLISNEIEKIKQQINYMNETKRKLNYYSSLQGFLENNFAGILETIEKKVMLKIKSDFDNFFQKWFYMLVDSEIIKVKLDDEFSPVIEQAGHEIDYINLSGGEKTAAALAYRLALNQIINTFISEIKTKDLLILDEPTDGFSSDQLDRLRFILQELNINQIIIVSHENKIESFADKIIKLNKQEHITQIIS